MRIRDLILIAIAFVGAVWTYQIKHGTENSDRQIKILKQEIKKEEKKILLYEADLAILSSPNNLSVHLFDDSLNFELQTPQPEQFITLETLPKKIDKEIIDPLSTLLDLDEQE